MTRINLLPLWNFSDSEYSVYDTESGTCIEMTSKVYNAMRNLQSDYNSFVSEVNKRIETFIESTEQDLDSFEKALTKVMHDYIHSIDTKIDVQDSKIDEAINFMKTNLSSSITEMINQMKANGELDEAIANSFNNLGTRVETLENTEYSLVYEEGTENLILQKSIKDGE